ncbi:PREDICTED: centromere protein C [Elephantulus edwardii]|uniref:centromere protein C n=1 Tax=Elephantulus edwardii TaxID=28737 RepID=UPI0003F0772C|nr:PREDICTED: centromere protein C [Elephantulus edwardii]
MRIKGIPEIVFMRNLYIDQEPVIQTEHRILDINVEEGRNILEIVQDYFEEKSLPNDFSTESIRQISHSQSEIKETYIQSPSKEKSHLDSFQVSSEDEDCCMQFAVSEEDVIRSVQTDKVFQEVVATDVDSENTSDLKKVSNKKLNVQHNKADEEFYLSVRSSAVDLEANTSLSKNVVPSVSQKGETYTFENSVNMQSPNTKISYKIKKRLNFEDKVILKKVEKEDNVSVEPSGRKPSGTFQKRTKNSEIEFQPQAKKSFSTLFIETVQRQNESSSVTRHVTTAPLHSSSPNGVKLLEDEFIIDESKTSFAHQSWIKIPRKVKPSKQCPVSPVRLQGRESVEKHHSTTSEILTSNTHSNETHPVEKSHVSKEGKLGRSCASTDKLENNCKPVNDTMYPQSTEASSEIKRTIQQKRKRKINSNAVEEELNMEQPKDKNRNISPTADAKLGGELDKNVELCEEIRNPISKKQMTHRTQKKSKEKIKKKPSSNGPKKEVVPEEVPVILTKSQRISRRPSNWWEVSSVHSPVNSNSFINNEFSVNRNSRVKPAQKPNCLSKKAGEKTTQVNRQKTATQHNSRAQKILNAENSVDTIDHDDISSSQNESLECDKADLIEKKNLDHPGSGNSKDQDSSPDQNNIDSITTAQSFHINSQTSGYSWKKGKSFTPSQTLIFNESGPILQTCKTSEKNDSDTRLKEAQKSSDGSRAKISKVITENKIHSKLVLPSDTPNVRRTKRTRLKPLQYWRGERIDYKARPSGGFVIGGILSPVVTLKEEKAANKETRKVNKITNRKRICLDEREGINRILANVNIPLGDPSQPTLVKDPETRESIFMELIRPRDTCQFFFECKELKVHKILDTPFFSTGKLILGPYQEKGKQHVGLDTLIFFVNFGKLLCTLHETPYLISTGDSFYVPSGNYYNIRNLLNEESILLFTQIKN